MVSQSEAMGFIAEALEEVERWRRACKRESVEAWELIVSSTLPLFRASALRRHKQFFLPLGLVNILAAGLWAWLPFPTGTIVSALLLIASAWLLIRANHPAPLERRTYVFAE